MACRLTDQMKRMTNKLEEAGIHVTDHGKHRGGHCFLCIKDNFGRTAKLTVPHSPGDSSVYKFISSIARRALEHGVHV